MNAKILYNWRLSSVFCPHFPPQQLPYLPAFFKVYSGDRRASWAVIHQAALSWAAALSPGVDRCGRAPGTGFSWPGLLWLRTWPLAKPETPGANKPSCVTGLESGSSADTLVAWGTQTSVLYQRNVSLGKYLRNRESLAGGTHLVYLISFQIIPLSLT